MKIADVSINRPVFAIMMSLALVTLGIFSYRTLGVDLMPKTDQPQVNVNIQLPGASPEEMESSIAKKVEENVTNTLRDQGMERHEALITSSHVRLRPILMTTISIVAGMLPIAFGRGAGAGSRATMAVTIIGGQMLCLLLTLLVTPVVYSYFDDLREWSPSRLLARLRRRATQPGTASF